MDVVVSRRHGTPAESQAIPVAGPDSLLVVGSEKTHLGKQVVCRLHVLCLGVGIT